MNSERQPTDLVEIRTGWTPIAFALGFAGGGALVGAALASPFDATAETVAAACGATLAASSGGLVALWFGAELSRQWSWLFALSLGWYVTLACLLGGLTLWPSLVVGVSAALGLGPLLVWRLAGFARRARGPSFIGVYVGPLIALAGVLLLLLGGGDGLLGAILLFITVPLAIPLGAVIGALLGAER